MGLGAELDVGNRNRLEMDESVIVEVCTAAGTAFGFIRNVSDPVQDAALPSRVQSHWGSTGYDVRGFYTRYNSAGVAWAMRA